MTTYLFRKKAEAFLVRHRVPDLVIDPASGQRTERTPSESRKTSIHQSKAADHRFALPAATARLDTVELLIKRVRGAGIAIQQPRLPVPLADIRIELCYQGKLDTHQTHS